MTSETLTAEPFLSGLYFGECPRWHDGRLWYSDFFDHAVSSGVPRRRAPGRGGLRRRAGGPGLAARRPPAHQLPPRPRHHAPRARRHPRRHGDLKPWATWHANDMVVASNGQAYAGNFGFDLDGLYDGSVKPSDIAPASLVRVDPDGTSCEAAADLQFPNGAVITDDGATLDHRRELRRAPHRVRPRRRRHAEQSTGVGRARRASPPTASACAPTARSGSPTRWRPSACASPRVARSSSASTTSHELLRLHAGRRRPPHALHGHCARQPRRQGAGERNGAIEKVRTTRARRRAALRRLRL